MCVCVVCSVVVVPLLDAMAILLGAAQGRDFVVTCVSCESVMCGTDMCEGGALLLLAKRFFGRASHAGGTCRRASSKVDPRSSACRW